MVSVVSIQEDIQSPIEIAACAAEDAASGIFQFIGDIEENLNW